MPPSLFPPTPASSSPPPYKQFSSLVMPSLILYGQTFLSPSTWPWEKAWVTCKSLNNITASEWIPGHDNKRAKQQKKKKRGGGGTRGRTCHYSHEQRGDTHMHALHMRFLSFQQHAVVFCKTFPSSFPSLCIQDIPLNRAETCLKTDPCFHSVLGERRGGREGQCRNMVRLNLRQTRRVRVRKRTNWKVNHHICYLQLSFRWRAHWLISRPCWKSRNTQKTASEPLGVEHVTPWRLSLIGQHLEGIFEGRNDIKCNQGQTPKCFKKTHW